MTTAGEAAAHRALDALSTSESAQAAYPDSSARAERGRQLARVAYGQAAECHRRAADVAEAAGDPLRAERHRELAAADEARGAELN